MSEAATTYPVGTRVLVSPDADDVWFSFDGEATEGVVVEETREDRPCEQYRLENRINVQEANGTLTQYVRPEDLTVIEN